MNYAEYLNLSGETVKEIPCILGKGAPTSSTAAAVGMLYMDTVTGDVYKCTAVSGDMFTWVAFRGGGNVELAQSLEGNDEDKAPSVKAVNEKLADFVVQQHEDGDYVYAHVKDEDKDQEKMVPYVKSNIPGGIAYMSSIPSHGEMDYGGYLNTSNPSFPYNCANMRYVDSMSIRLFMDSNYKLTARLYVGGNDNDEAKEVSEAQIDLPIEMIVERAEVSTDGKTLIITFRNGSVVYFSVENLVKGLATKVYVDEIIKSVIVDTLKGNDLYKAPSVYAVNAGLNKRVEKVTKSWQVYIAGANGAAETRGFSSKNNKYYFPVFGLSSDGTEDGGGFLTTATPLNPYHAVNKKYVDDAVQGLLEAIGTVVATVTKTGDNLSTKIAIPENALTYACVENSGFEALNANGESVYKGYSTQVTFLDAKGYPLGDADIKSQRYVKIPEGAAAINFNAKSIANVYAATWDGSGIDMSDTVVVFQVKVGA